MAGMFFTLVSDYFLVLYDKQRVGTPIFCAVHICYILRAADGSRVRVRTCIGIVGALCICALSAAVFFDGLIVASGLYAVLFMGNLSINLRWYGKTPDCLHKTNRGWSDATRPARPCNRGFVLAGLLLFALCDVNVLLYNLPNYTAFPVAAAHVAYRLIWVFYTPAQGLLAVSAIQWRRKASARV